MTFFSRGFSNLPSSPTKSCRIALCAPLEPDEKITSPGCPRAISFCVSALVTIRGNDVITVPSSSLTAISNCTSAISMNLSRCGAIIGVIGTQMAPRAISASSNAQEFGEKLPSIATT